MKKRVELTTIPAGSKIRVGAPSERPEQAIEVLIELFTQNPSVLSARLGLMEIQYPEGRTEFSYTIGIECSGDEGTITKKAVEAISAVTEARWPIAIVPPKAPYLSEDAIVFYMQKDPVEKPFKKLLGKLGLNY